MLANIKEKIDIKKSISLLGLVLLVLALLVVTKAVQQPQDIRKQAAESYNYDVIIVGGTSSGLAAALSAGRMGVRVALIEETGRLGGILSNGLSVTDLGNPGIDFCNFKASSGIFEEFRQQIKNYYHNHPTLKDDPVVKNDCWAREGLKYEPRVAHEVIQKMVNELPNITVYYNDWPILAIREGSRLTGVVIKNKEGQQKIFNAQIFIDATDSGDLAVLAGAEYMVGREPRTAEEPHAGVIYYDIDHDQLLPGSTGEGDSRIQAYSYLMTLKDYGQGADKTISRPLNYNPEKYRLSPPWQQTWATTSGPLPNKKFEVNQHPYGTDLPELNYNYPLASREERKTIEEIYKNHALGYLYFLQTELGLEHLGLADDEYPQNGNFPLKLYIREGRRILGEYLMKENDISPVLGAPRATLKADSIAIGDYPMDSHATQLKTDPTDPHRGEGEYWLYRQTRPYQIPYGVIVPKNIDRLLVSLAVSATHVAYSSLRMEPVRMSLGQAAGTAAVLSIKNNVLPRQVNVGELQKELLKQKQLLYYYSDVSLDNWAFENIQQITLKGIMVGYADYSFDLGKNVTRAEMAAVLVRAFNLPKAQPAVPTFDDVPKEHWAYEYIETLYKNGVTKGCADLPPRFCPENQVNRVQAAVFLTRVLGLAPYNNSTPTFADVPKTHWAYPYVERLYEQGLTKGCSSSPLKYCVEDPLKREELATFISRALKL